MRPAGAWKKGRQYEEDVGKSSKNCYQCIGNLWGCYGCFHDLGLYCSAVGV